MIKFTTGDKIRVVYRRIGGENYSDVFYRGGYSRLYGIHTDDTAKLTLKRKKQEVIDNAKQYG